MSEKKGREKQNTDISSNKKYAGRQRFNTEERKSPTEKETIDNFKTRANDDQ